MTAYYNENDPFAVQWLRQLIEHGFIARGVVDERSIEDVTPNDVKGFTQVHFFAGIGGWSYALRLARWSDERPVWTGSCPCQPFSAAGKSGGFADERHLWPAWFHLITQCRPAIIFGEQVSAKAALEWWDVVSSDFEATDYTNGAVDTCAASVGAPHIRQRLYWMAHDRRQGRGQIREIPTGGGKRGETSGMGERSKHRSALSMADSGGTGLEGRHQRWNSTHEQSTWAGGVAGVLGHTCEERLKQYSQFDCEPIPRSESPCGIHPGRSNPWSKCDWIQCRDGKTRPVESGSFPLAHGVPGRVGLLRGYGNAIVPQQAAEFVMWAMEFLAAV